MKAVKSKEIEDEDDGLRLDRWFKIHFPELSFGQLQKLIRTGQIRVDGSRVKSSSRLVAGQRVRIPPFKSQSIEATAKQTRPQKISKNDREALEQMTLFEDKDVLVLNKSAGLSVQGGSGITRHIDGMLASISGRGGVQPRLVHRLDRDTSGVLVVAKTRKAAVSLTKSFRARDTCKIYWALVKGVPTQKQGRISNYIKRLDNEIMCVTKHGDPDAQHALTFYHLVETVGNELSWVTLRPITGRTHQLRIQLKTLGNPIIGDPKYMDTAERSLLAGMQNKLHLHARRIVIPHPRSGVIDISALLPAHMLQSWNLLGLDMNSEDFANDMMEVSG